MFSMWLRQGHGSELPAPVGFLWVCVSSVTHRRSQACVRSIIVTLLFVSSSRFVLDAVLLVRPGLHHPEAASDDRTADGAEQQPPAMASGTSLIIQ